MFRWSSRKSAAPAALPLSGNAAMGVAAVIRGADEMAASMPPLAELEVQFAALLDTLAVTGDARTKMLSMESKVKWQMLCTQQKNVSLGFGQVFRHCPQPCSVTAARGAPTRVSKPLHAITLHQ